MTPTILLGLFATLLVVSGVQSAGHRIPLTSIPLSEQEDRLLTRALIRQPNTWQSYFHRQHRIPSAKAGGSVGLFQNAASFLAGNVSIGSPAQTVQVLFYAHSQDFFFLDPLSNATDASNEESESRVGRYDANASTTAVVNDQAFYAIYNFVRGNSTITDSILFGDTLSMPLSFGDASYYPYWVPYFQVVGIVGFSPFSRGETNLTSFASQLLSNNNVQPIVAKHVTVQTGANDNAVTSSGQLTIGAEDDDSCTAGSYLYVSLNGSQDGAPDAFRVDSISGQTPNGQALSLAINVNRSAVLADGFNMVAGSPEFIQLLANASGLIYNATSKYYELSSCADLSKAQNVTMNLAGGKKLTLAPTDYIFKTISDGTEKCVSSFYENSYSETDTSNSVRPIMLGAFFLNNHCYAYNYRDVTLGIASVKTPSLTTYNSH